MSGTADGRAVDGVDRVDESDPLKPRMHAISETMRELSADLDAHATLADKRPEGFTDAFRLIVLARDLGSVAHRLAAAAREMGQELNASAAGGETPAADDYQTLVKQEPHV